MNGSSRDRVSLLLLAAGVAALAFAALKPRSGYHRVTAAMSKAADTVAGRPATTLEAEGTDGRWHSPASDAQERPLVLFFIQDGCPCSEAAEPYFRRLQAAYGRDAAFLGVIDGDIATARDWAARHETPYPILADSGRRLIVACRAERSAYTMLVRPGGRIEALWPGYSAGMLAEAGVRLSRLAHRAEIPLDTRGAPEEFVSGCSF
jgi:peroxiredoxin